MIKNNFLSNINFFSTSLSMSINFFFSSVLIILLSLFNFLDLAAEIGLTLSFTLFLCQIFSANHRSLIYLEEYESKVNSIVQFRFIITFIILFISISMISILEFENQFFLIILSLLICIQWISEIFLTIKEKAKSYDYSNKILFTNLVFFSIILFSIFFNYIILINYFVIFIIVCYLLIFKKEFYRIKFTIKDLSFSKNILKNSFKNYEIISSFFLNFSNLIWRFSIFLYAGKSVAGLLFGSFAIGSFFGSVYYNILGPKIHSKKINFSKLWFLPFLFLTILLVFISFNYFKNLENIYDLEIVRISCILFSLSGSFIMILSLFIRFNYFYNYETKLVFKLDVIYSVLISFIISIIFYLLGLKFLVLAYFIASLCSLSVYLLLYLNNEKFF